jgi:hypothetical protein
MPSPDVNGLRDQLRALGYLDARVDRFVLGGAAGRRTAIALAAAASARIGLLAGLLLGPSAVIGTVTRVPGLVTRLSDAIVLAGYFGVCFGIATALAAFLVILPAGTFARRGATRPDFARRARRAALGAGVIIALACLAYLTLWWRTATDAAGLGSTAGTLAVLAVASAISLLLGHVVMLTALAYVARLGLGGLLTPGLARASWRAASVLAFVALSGALTLLFATAPRDDVDTAPPLAVVPTGQRVLLVAIDGIDRVTLARLSADGRLPVLTAISAGAAALPSDPNRDPARVWTTIATGQPPERHGISALQMTQLAGVEGRVGIGAGLGATLTTATDLIRLTRPAIASGHERRIPTFWEVAARAGLRTAVIHWWATWPADDHSGTVISDRAILRLERGGALDAEIAPASLYATLRATWPTRHDRAAAVAAAVAPVGASADVTALLRRSAELDATLIDLAGDASLGPLDLLVLYLPGLDIAQHALFTSDADGALAPSAMTERVSAVEAYYVFLDRALAGLARRAQEPANLVMLVTQPGRVAQPGPGLFALSSTVAGTRAGAGAGPEWIAPSVLYALGVPIASDLPDAGLAAALFSETFVAAHPMRTVATYGSRRALARRGAGQALDEEMIERMRSLGYVR